MDATGSSTARETSPSAGGLRAPTSAAVSEHALRRLILLGHPLVFLPGPRCEDSGDTATP